MTYEAEITLRVKFTREPDETEAEQAAASIERWLKGHTAVNTNVLTGRKRIGILEAEVSNWRDGA